MPMLLFHHHQVYTFKFIIDSTRLRYLWIPDFTEEEANNYLTKLGFTKDNEIRKKVFDQLGTRPSILRQLASSKMDYKEFIKNKINNDISSIHGCVKKDKSYINFLKEMIEDKNLDGMKDIKVMDLLDNSTSDIANGPLVKGFHILSYDIQNKRFQFHSKSMYHATKEYLNEIKK